MSAYEQFEATHRVLAHDDARVATCKSELVSALRAAATEFRVGIHATEHGDLPDDVASLGVPSGSEIGEGLTWRVGELPDDEEVLELIHDAMDDIGSLPPSVVSFHGARFDGLVTASTSHSHVGKLNVREPSSANDDFVADLNEALDGHGLIVPAGVIAAWERDGKYFEVSGPQLCVYATPVADLSEEERLSVAHHCHDLTALRSIEVDSDASRIDLSWESPDSIVVRAIRRIFGSPPAGLVVPREISSRVRSHLSRFVE